MQDHYKTLGINSSATHDEIRRAYRILARRYHPDVNPGKSSEDKFKTISAAYEVLSDPKKRIEYDAEYERVQIASFAEKFSAQFKRSKTTTKSREYRPAKAKPPQNYEVWIESAKSSVKGNLNKLSRLFKRKKSGKRGGLSSVSIIEISVTAKEAIFGQKKTIEIPQDKEKRKISVNIPAGVRSGSVLRLKQTARTSAGDEIVLIIRVAQHPFLSLQNKGLVVEVPVSIQEALLGANITLPTLDEAVLVKIPAGSQSGSEIRLKNKGVLQKDGSRADLIYRLLVKVPQSDAAVGIKEKLNEIERYYEEPVRRSFPSNFNDL
jgi:curved DNA-binding protein